MSVLDWGDEWLSRTLLGKASREVIYSRGAFSGALNAVIGRAQVDGQDERGLVVSTTFHDFIVSAADLNGIVTAPPEEGDTIQDGDQLYEVRPLAPGAGCWAWSDARKTVYRIHTIEKG